MRRPVRDALRCAKRRYYLSLLARTHFSHLWDSRVARARAAPYQADLDHVHQAVGAADVGGGGHAKAVETAGAGDGDARRGPFAWGF
jgi:hypothetical protein